MVNVSVDVDIDDILWGMSSSEKEELCEQLMEDGYGPDPEPAEEADDIFRPEMHHEREMVQLFKDMWANKLHMDHHIVEEIRNFLKTKNVL